MRVLIAGIAGLFVSSAAFAGRGPELEDAASLLHSAQYAEGIGGLAETANRGLQELATLELEEDIKSDVWWIWNPGSGSITSGCWISGCGGSGCFGSGCIFSGCGVSGCGGSGCASSDCEASLCGGSECDGSVCIGSDCEGSVCVGSACTGTVCQGSGCEGSVCAGSNCANSMCVNSGCSTNNCDNTASLNRESRGILAAALSDGVIRLATASSTKYALQYRDKSGSLREAIVVGHKGRVVEYAALDAIEIVSISRSSS